MPFVGMEEEDRRNITRNIGCLVELTNIDTLIPKLLEKGVFSQTMIEKYLPSTGLNDRQRKTELYLDIQRRGPTAFGRLIESLTETEHFELAQLLQPDLQVPSLSPRQESVTRDALPMFNHNASTSVSLLPSYFPNNLEERILEISHLHPNAVINLNTEPLQVSVKYATHRYDLQPEKKNLIVYRMGSQPKGYLLMINNIRFINNIQEERLGAEFDDLNLSILFQELGYEVMSYTNQGLAEMKDKIKEFAQMENHKHVDSCVVAILSHGASGVRAGSTDFLASDGGRLSSTWVLECFNNYNCPELIGKPKIFIFQSCRGDMIDYGVRRNIIHKPQIQTDSFPLSQIRSYSDILIAYSTIPGYVSNRDIYNGTWYIQTICKVFMDHARDTEIQDMLTIVDNYLRRLVGADSSTMQTSSFENWGFQKFYFNPGLYDNHTVIKNAVDDLVPK